MDYNIYIHNLDGDGGGKKTKSWNHTRKKFTTPKNKYSNATNIINKIGNPDSVISSAFSKAAKAIPAVAVAYAVLKVSDKIITTASHFVTTESGDYRFATSYNNFKTGMSVVFRPVSTIINYEKAQQQYRIEDNKRQQQAALLGDSVINSYYNYGV